MRIGSSEFQNRNLSRSAHQLLRGQGYLRVVDSSAGCLEIQQRALVAALIAATANHSPLLSRKPAQRDASRGRSAGSVGRPLVRYSCAMKKKQASWNKEAQRAGAAIQ